MDIQAPITQPRSFAARRRALQGIAAGAAAVALFVTACPVVNAQPAGKVIRIVVPYAAGGGTDILGRQLGEALAAELGSPVIVENRPGAGGNIGADHVAKAAPDGSTLLLGDMALAVNPSLFKRMPFDPIKDLQPIASVAAAPLVLIVNPDVKATNVKELVAQARANPGKLSFASAGLGNPPHMAGELFRGVTQTDIIHVPYKGVGPALTDVIGGQVSMLFTGLSSARQQIEAGKVRALAVTGASRAPTLPDTPTMTEAGFPKINVTSWWALFGPPGMPAEKVAAISAATKKVLGDPRLKGRLSVQSIEASPGDAAFMRRKLAAETDRWRQVIQEAKITPE
jgi:tripartite-type tricarboxylate transporter receptor subunit TctC